MLRTVLPVVAVLGLVLLPSSGQVAAMTKLQSLKLNVPTSDTSRLLVPSRRSYRRHRSRRPSCLFRTRRPCHARHRFEAGLHGVRARGTMHIFLQAMPD